MSNFVVREFQEGDRDYICRTVLVGLWEADAYTRRINKESFYSNHNRILKSILNVSKCLVIADTDDSTLIYGFIIYQPSMGDYDVIHYAYVRKDFRKLGLLKRLASVIKTRPNLAISHTNDYLRPAKLKMYYDKVIFDPYLLGDL